VGGHGRSVSAAGALMDKEFLYQRYLKKRNQGKPLTKSHWMAVLNSST
jgi:hypothetical protein